MVITDSSVGHVRGRLFGSKTYSRSQTMKHSCRTCQDARELLDRERARASIAESRGAVKDRLLGIVAAESSAMANSLLGWTQALRRDFKSQSAREHALGVMEARIGSHLAVLERLLDASGTPHGQELSLVRLDLRALVKSAVAGQRGLADERPVRLHDVGSANGDAVVLGDRLRVARAVNDLLVECIRSAEVGSSVDVEITGAAASASVRFTVSARGTLLDRARLGVLAATHAAELHGGSLETLADGFVLRLPIFVPAGAAPRTPRQKTLLVVRHDAEIAEVLATLATARGHRVLTVHDEELAARAFEVHAPDVVVVGSPDGFDRLRAVLAGVGERVTTVLSAADASELVESLAD